MNILALILFEDIHIFNAGFRPMQKLKLKPFPRVYNLKLFQINEVQLEEILFIFSWIQAAASTLMGVVYMAKRKGYIDSLIQKEEQIKNLKVKFKKLPDIQKSNNAGLTSKLSFKLSKFYVTFYNQWLKIKMLNYKGKYMIFVYYMVYIIISWLGIIFPTFTSGLLIDIFRQYPQLKLILQSIWIPKKQIVYTIILFIIMTYYFSLLYYFNFYMQMDPVCRSLSGCMTMMIDATFKTNGGFLGFFTNDYSDEWEFNL